MPFKKQSQESPGMVVWYSPRFLISKRKLQNVLFIVRVIVKYRHIYRVVPRGKSTSDSVQEVFRGLCEKSSESLLLTP